MRSLKRGSVFLVFSVWLLAGIALFWNASTWQDVWVERSLQFFPEGWVNDSDFENIQNTYPIYQSNDTYYWVRLAENRLAGKHDNLRYVQEGVGEGRINAWHSFPATLLAAVARITEPGDLEKQKIAVRSIAHWLGPLLGWLLLLPVTILLASLVGSARAVFFIPLFVFNPAIQWDFGYSRYDHEIFFHLSLLLQIVGLVALLQGRHYRWGIVAGVGSAWGWWAVATVQATFGAIAIIALCSTKGMNAYLKHREKPVSAGTNATSDYNWKSKGFLYWGASAFILSLLLLFYERRAFFTQDLTALHSMHAVAQLGAGLFAASLFLHTTFYSRKRIFLMCGGLFLGLAPVYWFLIHGQDAHIWLDPFVRVLHSYITEFQSPFTNGLWRTSLFWSAILLACVGVGLGGVRITSDRIFVTVFIVFLLGLACMQTRWLGLLATASLVAVLVSVCSWRRFAWVSFPLVFIFLLIWVNDWIKLRDDPPQSFVADLLLQVGSRDVNLHLQDYAAGETIRVIYPFDFAAVGALFPQIHPLGSFYWENRDGLFASTQIMSSSDDEEILGWIKKHKIDYIVVQPGYLGKNFTNLSVDAMSSVVNQSLSTEGSLAWRLSNERKIPSWCQRLEFFGTINPEIMDVRIYKVLTD